MDFLRRLHPSHAEGFAAARLDLPPRWAAAAPASPLTAVPARARTSLSADDDRSAANTAQAPVDHGLLPAASHAAPQTSGTGPARAAPAVHMAPTGYGIERPSSGAELRGPVERDAPRVRPQARQAKPERAPLLQPGGALRVLPTTTGLSTADGTAPNQRIVDRGRHKPQDPLRPPVLQQAAQRVAKGDAAPVVHITIDRIDVRIPPGQPDAPPARKPRAAATVAPLAEYLRASDKGVR